MELTNCWRIKCVSAHVPANTHIPALVNYITVCECKEANACLSIWITLI